MWRNVQFYFLKGYSDFLEAANKPKESLGQILKCYHDSHQTLAKRHAHNSQSVSLSMYSVWTLPLSSHHIILIRLRSGP